MATYQLFGATSGPGSQAADTDNYTLAVEFYVTQPGCAITQIRFWASGTVTGSDHASRLYNVGGPAPTTLVGGSSKAFPSPLQAGWNTVTLDAPIALVANQRYRAGVYFTTDNGYTATGAYWTSGAGSAGHTAGPLVAPNSAAVVNNEQGSFASGADSYPAGTFGGGNYWIDVTIDDGPGVANMLAWYKADAVTGLTDGADLAAWPDSSGNGYVTEQPFGLKPFYKTGIVNSLPTARFRTSGDSSDRALRTPAPIANSSHTVFAVVNPTDFTSGQVRTIWCGDGGSLVLRILDGKVELVRSGVTILAGGATTLSLSTWYVISATFTVSTSASIHLNGVQDVSATHAQALTASSFTYLGGSGIFGGQPFYGDIAEVLHFNAALNSTDRATVESYLATKYAIGGGGPPAASFPFRRRPGRGLILR